MKARTFLVIGGLAAMVTVTGFSGSSTEADRAHFQPETADEQAWIEDVRKEIDNTLWEAYDDGMASFSIDKDMYQYYDLHTGAEAIQELTAASAQHLKTAVFQSVLGKDKEIQPGDIKPGLFINKEHPDEAFVLFKSSADGKNHLYWFERDASDATWSLTKKEVQEGKRLAPLRLKPLEEFKDSRQQATQPE